MIDLENGVARIVGKVDSGYIFVDGPRSVTSPRRR